VVQAHVTRDSLSLKIGSDLKEVTRVAAKVAPLLNHWQVDSSTEYRVQLVLEEIISNVIRHGFTDEGQHDISVDINFDGECVEIRVRDDGAEFNPIVAPPADVSSPLQERSAGGFGLHLVRAFVQSMDYRRDEGCNDLRIRV
jgi:serine/threonine-protein kinase RsbW